MTSDLGPRILGPRTLGPWGPRLKTLRSGTWHPKTRDPGTWYLGPGTWYPRTWDPRTLGLGTSNPWILGPGNLTLGALKMGPWDPETSNWPPPQIVLYFFVKQISIIKSWDMCVKNVPPRIQKIKFRDTFFSFLFQK